MQAWAILAAKHAALTSGIGIGAFSAPLNSLARVALGLLLAGMGIAAVSARRRAPSCPLGPAGGQIAAAHSVPAGGWGSRFRRRVDGVLTGMLSDDEDKLQPVGRRTSVVEAEEDEEAETAERVFEARSAWRGDYVDALPWRDPQPSGPNPAVLPKLPDPSLAARASAGRSSAIVGTPEISVTPWPRTSIEQAAEAFSDSPWFIVSAAFDGEQLWPLGSRRPGQVRNRADVDQVQATDDLEDFPSLPPPMPPRPMPRRRADFQWFAATPVVDSDSARDVSAPSSDERDARRWSAGPGSARAEETTDRSAGATGEVVGYHSKHRLDGPAKDAKPQDGRRPKARHAASAASASATVARKARRH